MKTITAAELHRNVDQILDELVRTGTPLEIKRGNARFQLVSLEETKGKQTQTGDPGHPITLSFSEAEEGLHIPWER